MELSDKIVQTTIFLGYDSRELMDNMFMIDRFKINEQKFNNSLGL